MMFPRLFILLTAIAVSGCAQPGTVSRGTAAQQAACRQRADEIFARRNPNDAYRTDQYVSGQRDTPFGGGVPADPTADLQARYSRDQLLDNCLRRANAQPSS